MDEADYSSDETIFDLVDESNTSSTASPILPDQASSSEPYSPSSTPEHSPDLDPNPPDILVDQDPEALPPNPPDIVHQDPQAHSPGIPSEPDVEIIEPPVEEVVQEQQPGQDNMLITSEQAQPAPTVTASKQMGKT